MPTTRCELVRHGSHVLARAPETIRGKLEVRGVGIVAVSALPQCELALVVDLVHPTRSSGCRSPASPPHLVGVELPLLRLAPFESSAPIKLALAVAHASRS